MTLDDEISPAQETAIVRAAGCGLPNPVPTAAGQELYEERRRWADELAAAGITLVPAWEGCDG